MPPAVRQFFVGGEVDPRLFGRTDLSRYQVSCATLRNFLLTPGGAAQNRPGTKLIREVKDSSKITRVVPFVFNSEQAYVIELGDQYMRFHRDEETVLAAGASADSKHTGGTHATIMTDAGAAFTVDGLIGMTIYNKTDGSSGVITDNDGNTVTVSALAGGTDNDWDVDDEYDIPYEIATPWLEDEIFRVQLKAQLNDLIVGFHRNHAPQMIMRKADNSWTLTPYTTSRSVGTVTTPDIVAASFSSTDADKDWEVVVCAIDKNGVESLPNDGKEGRASPISFTATIAPPFDTTSPLKLPEYEWAKGAGNEPEYYRIYRGQYGFFGHVGTIKAQGTALENWQEEGLSPDYSDTPPQGTDPLSVDLGVLAGGTARELPFGSPAPSNEESRKILSPEAGDDNYTFHFDRTMGEGDSISVEFQADNGSGYVTRISRTWSFPLGFAAPVRTIKMTQAISVDGMDAWVAGTENQFKMLITINNNHSGFADVDPEKITYTEAGTESEDVVYPQTGCFFEQRLMMGGFFERQPSTFKGSKNGDYTNFDESFPSREDDSLEFTLASQSLDELRHMIPLRALILLTAGAEWLAKGVEGSALSPASFDMKPDSEYGASYVEPVVAGRHVLFTTARQKIIREFKYDPNTTAIGEPREVTLLARHLLRTAQLVEMAWAEWPFSCVWAVRDDGILLGLTYIPEHDVWGWHRHDTVAQGRFESVCSVPEDTENAVYLVVKRVIDGSTVRFIERFAAREGLTEIADYVIMDSALSFDGRNTDDTNDLELTGSTWAPDETGLTLDADNAGTFKAGDVGRRVELRSEIVDDDTGRKTGEYWVRVQITAFSSGTQVTVQTKEFGERSVDDPQPTQPTTVPSLLRSPNVTNDWGFADTDFAGLDHLEGQSVAILYDGQVHAQQTVTSGAIQLGGGTLFGERVHAGLPFQSDLETLPVNVAGDTGSVRIEEKSIVKMGVEVDGWKGLYVGQFLSDLEEVDQRSVESGYGTTNPTRGTSRHHVANAPARELVMVARQQDPLPVTLLALTADLHVGDEDVEG